MHIEGGKKSQRLLSREEVGKDKSNVKTGETSKKRVKGKGEEIKSKAIEKRSIQSLGSSAHKSKELREEKGRTVLKKTFEDALETFRLHGSTTQDITRLREEFSSSIEKMEFFINYVEERKIEEAFEEAFKMLEKLCPNLDEETLRDLREEFTTVEKQRVFIKKVKGYVEEEEAKESREWGAWLWSRPKRLEDRVIKEYERGVEEFAKAKKILGGLAEGIFQRAQDRVTGSIIGEAGGYIINRVNASFSLFGNIGLGAARSVIPFMAGWGVKFGEVATGIYSHEKSEETAEEVQMARKAVEDYLGTCKVSDRVVQDLSDKAISTFSRWTQADAILAFHGSFPDIGGVMATMARGGVRKLPEYVMHMVLVGMLMEGLGPVQVPDYIFPGKTITQAGWMTPAQVWVLASCIMTIIRTGSVPVKDSLIAFFLESTLLAKVVNIQKLVLANVQHPVPFFALRYLTAKAVDDFVRVPMKGLIKGGLNIAIEEVTKKVGGVQKTEIEKIVQREEKDE